MDIGFYDHLYTETLGNPLYTETLGNPLYTETPSDLMPAWLKWFIPELTTAIKKDDYIRDFIPFLFSNT